MNVPGSADSIKVGNLKRRLPTIRIAHYAPEVASGTGIITMTGLLKGLAGLLNGFIGVGAMDDTIDVTDTTNFPAGWCTVQFVPMTFFPDGKKVPLRPVFQDPAAASPHQNNPLPQDAPFGYNFPAEIDEIKIIIKIDTSKFGASSFDLVLQAMVEFNGAWWDAKAAELAIGQVQLIGPSGDIKIVGTGAG